MESLMQVSIESMALNLKRFYNQDQEVIFTDEIDRDWWMNEILCIITNTK